MFTFMKRILNNNNNNNNNNSNNSKNNSNGTASSNNNNNNNNNHPSSRDRSTTGDSRSHGSPSNSTHPSDRHHHHHLHNHQQHQQQINIEFVDDSYDMVRDPLPRSPQIRPGVLQAVSSRTRVYDLSIGGAFPLSPNVDSEMQEKCHDRASATSSLSASKTSKTFGPDEVRQATLGDESAKENLVGASGPGNRRSPPISPSGAPLYDSSPTSSRLGSSLGPAKAGASHDVCCCALCNKARQERRKGDKSKTSMDNSSNDRLAVAGGATSRSDDRTLREISLKSNSSNEGYTHDDDDDDEGDRNSDGESSKKLEEFSSRRPAALMRHLNEEVSERVRCCFYKLGMSGRIRTKSVDML